MYSKPLKLEDKSNFKGFLSLKIFNILEIIIFLFIFHCMLIKMRVLHKILITNFFGLLRKTFLE